MTAEDLEQRAETAKTLEAAVESVYQQLRQWAHGMHVAGSGELLMGHAQALHWYATKLESAADALVIALPALSGKREASAAAATCGASIREHRGPDDYIDHVCDLLREHGSHRDSRTGVAWDGTKRWRLVLGGKTAVASCEVCGGSGRVGDAPCPRCGKPGEVRREAPATK